MKYAVLVPKTATNVATGTAAVAGYFEADGNVVVANASATITWLGKIIGYGTVVSHSADLKTAIIRTMSARTGATTYSLYDFTPLRAPRARTFPRCSNSRTSHPRHRRMCSLIRTTIRLIAQTSAKIVSIDSDTHRATAIETAPAGETIESPIAVSPSVMAWARYAERIRTSQIIVYDKFSGDTTDSSLIIKARSGSSRGYGTTSSASSQATTRSISIMCRTSNLRRSPMT